MTMYEQLMSVAGVAVLVAVPAFAGISPDVTLEVWDGQRGQPSGVVERITISSEATGTGAARRPVWHAKREFIVDGTTFLINSDQCPQFKDLLANFLSAPVAGPDLIMDYEVRQLPPIRKDGADYRMGWRTYGGANVSVSYLPPSLYQWTTDLRTGLASCWEAGRVAPGAISESD